MAYDDDDLDNEGWDGNVRSLPPGLRKHVRALEKQVKEKDTELATLRTTTRTQTIATVLHAKGINPKVARLISSDVEATDEAVAQWIDDYKDIFNLSAQAQTPAATAQQVDPRTGEAVGGIPAPLPNNVYDLAATAQQQMDAAYAGGVPLEVANDILAKINATTSIEEMNVLIGQANPVRNKG